MPAEKAIKPKRIFLSNLSFVASVKTPTKDSKLTKKVAPIIKRKTGISII